MRFKPVGVFLIFTGKEHEVHVFKAAQERKRLLHSRTESHVGLREARSRHDQDDTLIERQTEACAVLIAITGLIETCANRDAGNGDA